MDLLIEPSDAPARDILGGDEAAPESPSPSRISRLAELNVSPWWLLALAPWTWFLLRDLHPLFEYLAITLPLLVGGSLVAAAHLTVSRRKVVWLGLLGSLLLFAIATILMPMRPTDRGAPINGARMASVNLGGVWFSNNDLGYLDQRKTPNVIVGSELAESHDQELRGRFDHAISEVISLEQSRAVRDGIAPQTDDYRAFGFPSIGVYSDHPLERLEDPIAGLVPGGLPGIRTRIELPDGPAVLYALHVPRPGRGGGVYEMTPTDQIEMIDAIADAVAAEELPVIMIGDLNVVDRSSGYRTLTADLHDAMREERWATPTRNKDFLFSLLLARIDHLLVSDQLCVENAQTETLVFSDHKAIYADVGHCESS